MAYLTGQTIGVDLTATPTVPAYAVGTIVETTEGTYMYVKANGAIAQYAMVKIDTAYEAAEGTSTLLPTTEPAAVGIAQVAAADNDYVWVHIGNGTGTVKVATTIAVDVKMTTTATAGAVGAGGTLIQGLTLTTATTAINQTATFRSAGILTTATQT